jgi:hypothetical protein
VDKGRAVRRRYADPALRSRVLVRQHVRHLTHEIRLNGENQALMTSR